LSCTRPTKGCVSRTQKGLDDYNIIITNENVLDDHVHQHDAEHRSERQSFQEGIIPQPFTANFLHLSVQLVLQNVVKLVLAIALNVAQSLFSGFLVVNMNLIFTNCFKDAIITAHFWIFSNHAILKIPDIADKKESSK
jgi:hypothetical protein